VGHTADPHAHLLAIDGEHRQLGVVEAGLQRRHHLRERQPAQVGEGLRLMDQHRRRAFDDVLLDDERQDIEQRLAVRIGKRILDVAGELAEVRSGRHGFS
jgi:hypothetical protein